MTTKVVTTESVPVGDVVVIDGAHVGYLGYCPGPYLELDTDRQFGAEDNAERVERAAFAGAR